jgi:hypothetical protein
MLLTTLADGTDIYHCINCGKVWGERLVRFDVAFQLSEVAGNGHNLEAEQKPESILALALSTPAA